MTPWTAVVPVKPVRLAKSRLELKSFVRMQFALASALDLVDVLCATSDVGRIVVVTCDAHVGAAVAGLSEVVVLHDRPLAPDGGHDGAVRAGSIWARSRYPDRPVLLVPADLTALSPAVLGDVLAAMAEHPASFVADTDGQGTTLMGFGAGTPVRTWFGNDSALLHRTSGYQEVLGVDPRARRDVDEVEHLRQALELGVGPRVTSVLDTYRVSLDPRLVASGLSH